LLDTTICKQTQITCIRNRAFLQTTSGKDEPNIVFMRKWTSQDGTKDVTTHNRTTQKTKKVGNTDPTKNTGMNSGTREEQAVPASF